MNNMIVTNNFPTPEFRYTVTMVFPSELENEEIFKNNLSHVYGDLKELIRTTNLLKRDQEMLKFLKFDSQKNKQLDLIEKNKIKIDEINCRMSNEISPYVWTIFEDVDDYVYECQSYVKADYLMILRRTRL